LLAGSKSQNFCEGSFDRGRLLAGFLHGTTVPCHATPRLLLSAGRCGGAAIRPFTLPFPGNRWLRLQWGHSLEKQLPRKTSPPSHPPLWGGFIGSRDFIPWPRERAGGPWQR